MSRGRAEHVISGDHSLLHFPNPMQFSVCQSVPITLKNMVIWDMNGAWLSSLVFAAVESGLVISA